VARRDRLAAFAAGLRTDDIVVVETTHSLIGGDKVDGTAAYGSDQEKIGSIERVMIDKISGKVAYAVLSFGGYEQNHAC